MTIFSSDGKMMVDIGETNTWKALYSTILVRLGNVREQVPLALAFFHTGKCAAGNCLSTARQFNQIRDALSKYAPSEMVYDFENTTLKAPWGEHISPVITSCANYFTTADGKDLLAEIVCLLSYSAYARANVEIS